jgi:hypothetical protein
MLDPRIEQALQSREPVPALREFATRLFAAGHSREAILDLFERSRQLLRDASRDSDEDAVTDVMDFLVGWCSPHLKLPPKESTSGRS